MKIIVPTYEGLRLKILKIKRVKFVNRRLKKIKNRNFSIISNNCWGGMIYESNNLTKMSPTVGLFFMASDYIKFLKNLKKYINADLKFIKPESSKWKSAPQLMNDKRFGTYPIGVLSVDNEDVEVFFLHYHSKEEAKDKWKRRCKRINWDNLIIKFNDQNGCTDNEIDEFVSLPFKHKLFFTCNK